MRSNNKQKGDNSEIAFMYKAHTIGLIISQPFGEQVYDFIIDSNGKLSRIQVKSCHKVDKSSKGEKYKLMTVRGSKHITYNNNDIDFLVGHIVPMDCWYIIPISEVENKYTISLFTGVKNSISKYEKYRNNWNLLK